MESINEKIKRIRLETGVNQADVARSAGIKQSSYASIEKGDTKAISIEVGKGIAKALKISFNELFDIEVFDEKLELINKLAKEYEEAKQRTDEIIESLDDKRKLLLEYEGKSNYYDLFLKHSLNIIKKEKDIKAVDLYKKVNALIQNEKGYIFIGYNDLNGGLFIKETGTEE